MVVMSLEEFTEAAGEPDEEQLYTFELDHIRYEGVPITISGACVQIHIALAEDCEIVH